MPTIHIYETLVSKVTGGEPKGSLSGWSREGPMGWGTEPWMGSSAWNRRKLKSVAAS